jgi:hypothetical protein
MIYDQMSNIPIPPLDSDDADQAVEDLSPVAAGGKGKRTISVSEAAKAAKRAGFSILKADKLVHQAVFGQFVEQVGAIHLGRGVLAVAAERISSGLDSCEDLIATVEDPEVQAQLLKTKHDLLKTYIEAANSLIKSAQIGAETAAAEAQTIPGFLPRTAAVPAQAAQVNILINGKAEQHDTPAI